MAEKENILGWLPLLTKYPKYRRDFAWAADCSENAVPFLGRQRALKAVREASMNFRSSYGTYARILEGPPYTPPADQPD